MESVVESPLDVLSRAATMVQRDSPVHGGESGARSGPASSNTSSTTGSLRKWRKERRCVASAKAGAAGGVEARLPGSTAAAAAKLFLLVPLSVRGSAGIPTSPEGLKEAVSAGPGTLLKLESREDCGDVSGPLDMTQPREGSAKRPDSPPPQHQRPSVITCVTAAGRLSFSSPPSSPSDVPEKSDDSGEENSELGLGREIINSGDSCDPVIDEHFRRSLGSDYAHLFSPKRSPSLSASAGNKGDAGGNSVTITGMSVDDHFAKALGETWLKLQAAEMTKDDGKATDGDPKGVSSQRRGLVWCPPIEGKIPSREHGVKNSGLVGNFSTENK